MKKMIMALAVICCFLAAPRAQAQLYQPYYKLTHPNEISASYGVSLLGSMIGSVVNKANLVSGIVGDEDYVAIRNGGTKGVLNLGYTYQLNKVISVGATAGINRMSVNLEDNTGKLTAAAANIYMLMSTAKFDWFRTRSDVFGMYQSLLEGRAVPRSLLVKDMPKEKWNDIDFIVDTLDWKANVDPDFHKHHFLEPKLCSGSEEEGYVDYWTNYGKTAGKQPFTGKRLTVMPGAKVTIKDNGAYGLICVQGFGTINGMELSSPNMIRFGQLTHDEYFVTESASKSGVTFTNCSKSEPLVILRHFARRP